MGYRELINELRREGEIKAADIRLHAEQEIKRIREEAKERLLSVQAEYARKIDQARVATARELCDSAERQAATIRLVAENTLASRLENLSRESLHLLVQHNRHFEAFADELPDIPWEQIRVNPADLDAARLCFPEAEIIADSGIAGGIDARSVREGLRIDNTLEKRLARGWPSILPALMHEVREKGDA